MAHIAKNDARERKRFIREHQLAGNTYQEAVEIWNASGEIADSFAHDGIRAAEDLSEGDIQNAIDDWKTLMRLGL